MTIWITSGDRPSNGRLAIQQTGGFRRANPLKLKIGDWLINWGCSQLPNNQVVPGVKCLNVPGAVKLASNKHAAFTAISIDGVSTVPWTTSKDQVKTWLEKSSVVARTKLTGHSGEGIIIIEPGSITIPDAPLYTKYIPKTCEYRVHVVRNSVIDTQRKIRDPSREPTDWKVRSHDNGFIFARNNVNADINRNDLSIRAVAALGLDFGAVDLVQDKDGTYYVLEVNTAPGLEGQTIQSYVSALKEVCGGN